MADVEQTILAVLRGGSPYPTSAGARVYPALMPQGTTLPAISFQRISAVPTNSLEGSTSGIDLVRVQVDAWGQSYQAAKHLAGEIRELMDAAAVSRVLKSRAESGFDDYEPELRVYRASCDYICWQKTSVPFVIDSYALTNYSGEFALPSGGGAGQAFTASAHAHIGSVVLSIRHDMTAYGDGFVWCELYAATGVVGTNAVPDGPPLAITTSIYSDHLPTTQQPVRFVFNSRYQLEAGAAYCIAIQAGSSNGALRIGFDGVTPTHAGNWINETAGSWGALSNRDLLFELWSA